MGSDVLASAVDATRVATTATVENVAIKRMVSPDERLAVFVVRLHISERHFRTCFPEVASRI